MMDLDRLATPIDTFTDTDGFRWRMFDIRRTRAGHVEYLVIGPQGLGFEPRWEMKVHGSAGEEHAT